MLSTSNRKGCRQKIIFCVILLFWVLSPVSWTLSTSSSTGFERNKRSVFDIMPSRNTEDLAVKKTITARVSCTCQEQDGLCGQDQYLICRTILNTLPPKHSSRSRKRQMHRRRQLRKRFSKWLEQNKASYPTLLH